MGLAVVCHIPSVCPCHVDNGNQLPVAVRPMSAPVARPAKSLLCGWPRPTLRASPGAGRCALIGIGEARRSRSFRCALNGRGAGRQCLTRAWRVPVSHCPWRQTCVSGSSWRFDENGVGAPSLPTVAVMCTLLRSAFCGCEKANNEAPCSCCVNLLRRLLWDSG